MVLRYEIAWGNVSAAGINELLADIERRTRWEMDLEDDSVEYQDVERLADEHWDIASEDADNRDVEIDQIDIEDIYLEDTRLKYHRNMDEWKRGNKKK
jgi:hypothetical protein